MVGKRNHYWVIGSLLIIAIALLFNYHWRQLGVESDWRVPINSLAFGWLAAMIYLAHANRPITAKRQATENMFVAVVVPVFNEDPKTFTAMLKSLNRQTRQPDYVYIVDDGSTSDLCHQAYGKWARQTELKSCYFKQPNAGKREAQAVAFRDLQQADVFVTIDSDTVLDEKSIEQGIMPFANPRVMSVAGLLLGLNYNANLLTRLVDIGFVTSFLNGRSAWSKVHSVAVNCGGLAFYRANVVHAYLNEYTTQTVLGQRATCGDDRILTNFALLDGWAVFQETSVGYTLLPVKFKHLMNQRIRWWRSFFWGGEWLIRRFPVNRLVWWLVVWQFCSFVMYTLVVPTVLIISPVARQTLPWAFFAYIFMLSYVRNTRYLSVRRPDQPLKQQWLIYLLSPLSTLLHMFLCTVLQYVGLATIKNMGWGTRKKVEVGLTAS